MEQLNQLNLLLPIVRVDQRESNKPFLIHKKPKYKNKPDKDVANNEYLQQYIEELKGRNASCI